jgi:hypothetical protein
VALSARWYGADPRAAREGLHAFAAAAGLRPARLARPVACTAAALACLVEVPAELDRRPVHLRPAVLRGGEPAGPSARGTIPLGRTRAGREFALAPADFAGHAYVLGPSGTGKTTLLGRLVNGLAAAGGTFVLAGFGVALDLLGAESSLSAWSAYTIIGGSAIAGGGAAIIISASLSGDDCGG